MVGWIIAAGGFMLMQPILRQMAEYHAARVRVWERTLDEVPAYAPVSSVQQAFVPGPAEEPVFGQTTTSAKEGAGTEVDDVISGLEVA